MKRLYSTLLLLPFLHACTTLTISGAQVGVIEKKRAPSINCKEIKKLSESDRNANESRARSDIQIILMNQAALSGANLLALEHEESRTFMKGITINAVAYNCEKEELIRVMSKKSNLVY